MAFVSELAVGSFCTLGVEHVFLRKHGRGGPKKKHEKAAGSSLDETEGYGGKSKG